MGRKTERHGDDLRRRAFTASVIVCLVFVVVTMIVVMMVMVMIVNVYGMTVMTIPVE